LEIESETEGLQKLLRKALPEETEIPDIQAALIFSNPEVTIQAEEAPTPALLAKKLKDFMRTTAKQKPISAEMVLQIQNAINPLEEIVDSE
jgi:hypothetical protein